MRGNRLFPFISGLVSTLDGINKNINQGAAVIFEHISRRLAFHLILLVTFD